MATSTIKKSGVRVGGHALDAAVASWSTTNLVQVVVKTEEGNYVLQTTSTGIELRNTDDNTLIHKVNWTS